VARWVDQMIRGADLDLAGPRPLPFLRSPAARPASRLRFHAVAKHPALRPAEARSAHVTVRSATNPWARALRGRDREAGRRGPAWPHGDGQALFSTPRVQS